MSEYVLFTDTNADIHPSILDQWGVGYTNLTFRFEGEDRDYINGEMSGAEFYAKMRKGDVAKTAAANAETFKELFRPTLEAGKDVLYLAFSSGLSTTYQSSAMAAEELKEEFPERKIAVVDTLAASAGQGLLVYLANEQKKAGASLEEVAKYVEDNRLHLCHWFTVDDLVYLKRGGRVSPAVAFVGGMLGIKPVLHVDDEGHLINMGKVRGRKASLQALADKYAELALDPGKDVVFISHADCIDDVETLKSMLKEKGCAEVAMVNDICPVIGSHSGPGTMAVFFLGKHR